MRYIPKGSLCIGCINNTKDCSTLDFSMMQPLKEYDDGTVAVKCDEYMKGLTK